MNQCTSTNCNRPATIQIGNYSFPFCDQCGEAFQNGMHYAQKMTKREKEKQAILDERFSERELELSKEVDRMLENED